MILLHPYVLLILAPLIWAGNAVVGKLADGLIEPMTLTFFRWSLALLVLLPFVPMHLRQDWALIKSNWGRLAFYGCVGFTLFNVLLYTALTYTSVVNVSIEQACIPILTLLLGALLFKESVSIWQGIGVILAFVGVFLTISGGQFERILQSDLNRGDVLMLLASLAYALYSLALRFKPAISWWSFIFVLACFAWLTSIPFALYEVSQATEPVMVYSWATFAVIVYVGLLPSIVAQIAYAFAVTQIGAAHASFAINLIPVFGVLLAIILLGEALQIYHIVGIILVFTGIGLSEKSRKK